MASDDSLTFFLRFLTFLFSETMELMPKSQLVFILDVLTELRKCC